MSRPRTVEYQSPDPAELARARETRLKELQMMDILREIVFYAIFLWILMVISYSIRDNEAYPIKSQLTNAFVHPTGRGYSAFPKVSLWNTDLNLKYLLLMNIQTI